MPVFSIIVPNYNHAAFLSERIESILHQSFEDFEMIILDDKSTDNSREIIETYRTHPKVSQIIYNETNSGSPFLQWKKGIELATADWIWIAESDDLAASIFLEEAVKNIKNNPSVGCYYTDSSIIDENGNVIGKVSTIKNNFFESQKWSSSYLANGITELNESLKFLCTINNVSSFVFKKEIFIPVKDQIIYYRYYGDWFFYIQAMLQTNIYYNHMAITQPRVHGKNLVGNSVPIIPAKKEYFRLLLFLLSRLEVTNKKNLTSFFCLHYLGSGWRDEGIVKAISLLWGYLKMNPSLAIKIIPKLIWYKITGKKNSKKYP